MQLSSGAWSLFVTPSICEYADHLTGLVDLPSETLMVAVLLISLPESYSPLIVSLNTHPIV